jgi:hypothetical protein
MAANKNRFFPLFLALIVIFTLACNMVSEPAALTTTADPTHTSIPFTPTLQHPTHTPTSVPVVNCSDAVTNILNSIDTGEKAEDLRGGPDTERKNDFYTLSTYKVSENKITWSSDNPAPEDLTELQKEGAVHQEVWDYFTKLIPESQLDMLSEYIIATDGEQKLLAAVRQTDTSPLRWALIVDIADTANSKELTYTLIHEFAHLLTLNSKQVNPSQAIFDNLGDEQVYAHEALRCERYFTYEGCSRPDSYIDSYYENYWSDIYNEWHEARQTSNDKQFYKNMNEFYHKYQDRFVTDYAVVNPMEDIAESFSFFILAPKPAGNSIEEKKILFFYGFPELVGLRSEIRDRVCKLNP